MNKTNETGTSSIYCRNLYYSKLIKSIYDLRRKK